MWAVWFAGVVGSAKFRRQHAVEGYLVDFTCIERRSSPLSHGEGPGVRFGRGRT